jgi:hypothetical protein
MHAATGVGQPMPQLAVVLGLPCCLQELRRLSFRHMNMDEWNTKSEKRASQMARYHKAWQQVWASCPQLTYIQVER